MRSMCTIRLVSLLLMTSCGAAYAAPIFGSVQSQQNKETMWILSFILEKHENDENFRNLYPKNKNTKDKKQSSAPTGGGGAGENQNLISGALKDYHSENNKAYPVTDETNLKPFLAYVERRYQNLKNLAYKLTKSPDFKKQVGLTYKFFEPLIKYYKKPLKN